MSLAFDSKSGELREDRWNLMSVDTRSKGGWRSSVCWIGAAAVCLGLLLLTVILLAHNTSAISQWDAKYETLIYNLTKNRDALRDDCEALRDERDQLKRESSNLTKEMEILQSKYNTVAASRDELQAEVDRLSLNRTGRPCHDGWTKFNDKCYYVSPTGITKTWDSSRKDCKTRGADLVIVNTLDMLDFVTKKYSIVWIGLTDKEEEGRWKWVDGTYVVGDGLWQPGEPNNSDDEEHCAEASRRARAWNDVPCSRKFSWVCEA